jgi:hypothetical protein
MAVEESLCLVTEELRVLERACRKIGDGSGIAPLPDDEGEDLPSWTSPAGSPLSPRQILTLAVQALWNYPDFSVTYAEGLRGHSTPPQLVTKRITDREQQQILETENRGIEEQTRKAMPRPCPGSDSAPGVVCRFCRQDLES